MFSLIEVIIRWLPPVWRLTSNINLQFIQIWKETYRMTHFLSWYLSFSKHGIDKLSKWWRWILYPSKKTWGCDWVLQSSNYSHLLLKILTLLTLGANDCTMNDVLNRVSKRWHKMYDCNDRLWQVTPNICWCTCPVAYLPHPRSLCYQKAPSVQHQHHQWAKRDTKCLRLAKDLWSDEEHQQLDEVIKQRLVGNLKDGKPRQYDIRIKSLMAIVLKLVGEVASEGKHSHLFHVPAATEHHIVALEEDPELLRVVESPMWARHTELSVVLVRHFASLFQRNRLNLCLPEFLRASSVPTFPNHINPTYGQKKGMRSNKFTLPILMAQFQPLNSHGNASSREMWHKPYGSTLRNTTIANIAMFTLIILPSFNCLVWESWER